MVGDVLDARIRELGLASFQEYQLRLTNAVADELSVLAPRLTVGETFFLRDASQWQVLQSYVSTTLAQRLERSDRQEIRAWSAACSSGEEAYTLAIALRESLPDNWRVRVLGTDLNPHAIEHARNASYGANSFRGVPAHFADRHFEQDGNLHRINSSIRRLVDFRTHNLLEPLAVHDLIPFDIVFCRNVMIYFDDHATARVLVNLRRYIAEDGFLFLGHADSTFKCPEHFASLNVDGCYVYTPIPDRRVSTGGAPLSPRPQQVAETQARQIQQTPTPSPRSEAPAEPRPAATPRPPTAAAEPDASSHEKATSTEASVAERLANLWVTAEAHLRNGETQAAFEALHRIRDLAPDDANCRVELALLHAGAGNIKSAHGLCGEVLAVDPLSADGHMTVAMVFESFGDDSSATTALEKAIYLDSEFALAHFRLAPLLARAGRFRQSALAFENALSSLDRETDLRIRRYGGGFARPAIAEMAERKLALVRQQRGDQHG